MGHSVEENLLVILIFWQLQGQTENFFLYYYTSYLRGILYDINTFVI